MLFLPVNNMVAVDLRDISTDPDHAARVLSKLGLEVVTVTGTQVAELGRTLVGKRYVYRSHLLDAPEKFNCTTLPRYVFSQFGIWLPKFTLQQRNQGTRVETADMQPGDLVFRTGTSTSLFESDPADAVGHVGIVFETNAILHASYHKKKVCIASLDEFIGTRSFRGVTRVLFPYLRVLHIDPRMEITTSDDVRVLALKFNNKPLSS